MINIRYRRHTVNIYSMILDIQNTKLSISDISLEIYGQKNIKCSWDAHQCSVASVRQGSNDQTRWIAQVLKAVEQGGVDLSPTRHKHTEPPMTRLTTNN